MNMWDIWWLFLLGLGVVAVLWFGVIVVLEFFRWVKDTVRRG